MPMDFNFIQELQQKKIAIERRVTMAPYTSFRIGGAAELIALPDTADKLRACILSAQRAKIPYRILGQASNVLIASSGYPGMIILLRSNWAKLNVEGTLLKADGGLTIKRLCDGAMQAELSGLERLYGIPGSVGGALHNNSGAFGTELSELLESAQVLIQGQERTLTRDQLQFGYRRSLLNEQKHVLLSAAFRLKPGQRHKIRSLMEETMERRKLKQPLEYPSAGSVFKRPEGYYASALIDQCGLKGRQIGGAQVSEKHAGFIINRSQASSDDVHALISHIQKEVYAETSVTLECEIESL